MSYLRCKPPGFVLVATVVLYRGIALWKMASWALSGHHDSVFGLIQTHLSVGYLMPQEFHDPYAARGIFVLHTRDRIRYGWPSSILPRAMDNITTSAMPTRTSILLIPRIK